MYQIGHIDGLVGEAYSSTKVFNIVAKQVGSETNKPLKERLLNQIKCIKSELQELEEAVEAEDYSEIIKESSDLLITSMGALQVLEYACSSTKEDLLKVCANNLTKFVPLSDPNARQIVEDTVKMYEYKGEDLTVEVNQQFRVYVFKDSNGKVRKPSNYKTTVLSKTSGNWRF